MLVQIILTELVILIFTSVIMEIAPLEDNGKAIARLIMITSIFSIFITTLVTIWR